MPGDGSADLGVWRIPDHMRLYSAKPPRLVLGEPESNALRAEPARLRTLDAIDLATALSIRDRVGVVFCYDERLATAAESAALAVARPSARAHACRDATPPNMLRPANIDIAGRPPRQRHRPARHGEVSG